MSDAALSIYLDDHLGLITGEIELALRVGRENEGAPLAIFLNVYTDEVKQQKTCLEGNLAAVGGTPSSWKQAAGWLAEKIGRLKPNDSLRTYTDLARVIELEALVSAAHARLLLWETLRGLPLPPPTPPAASLEYAQVQEVTSRQLVSLRDHHQQAVHFAFK